MFRTGSPYSPFFTSGLLSEHSYPRRGSLPTDSLSTTTAPPHPDRDHTQLRSFLSLDLAESQSSLRSRPCNSFQFPRHPHSPDSLRTIPSPKPAPSITLPDLPVSAPAPLSALPPRLPSIAINPSLGLSLQRASHSAPSLGLSSAPNHRLSTISRTTSSSVSTRVRKINRSAALARLEGRSKSADIPAYAPKPIRPNFMSMSDDEDDLPDPEEDSRKSSDDWVSVSITLEPEDIVLPTLSPIRIQPVKSAPAGATFPSRSSLSSRKRKQQRQTKEWFPLKSFIDLHNDDEMSRWSWRSFIEVASLS